MLEYDSIIKRAYAMKREVAVKAGKISVEYVRQSGDRILQQMA